ncbi:hypothetical protein QWL27_25775 [Streptomyces thermocarboxydus]|uniref:hypothetical protein n=1 Tax=Streptomyces thermocarboxydus TaxID=59299 RepID=UPI0016792A58|nr:hypothetical protein [Streptomyces thermocarboxydus]GHE31784.1 hypothetical protein GCM10018771_09410 [Streptomyces cellulosae]
MRLSSQFGKAAMGAAVLLLLAGCAGERDAGGAVVGTSERPASWTDLPVRTGARDVVHTDVDDRPHTVRITVRSLVRGSEKDMRGARVGEELKGTVPHYLTFEVTNTGPRTIPDPFMVDSDLVLMGTDWEDGQEAHLSGGRPGGADLPCANFPPETLAPGASYEVCVTYALPEGVGVLSVLHYAGGYHDETAAVAVWPVDGGVETVSAGLAEPGDVIPVRHDADEDGILELPATPVSVRRGNMADLKDAGLPLTEEERRGVPYYVSVTYTNTGTSDLYNDQSDRIRLLTRDGRQIPEKSHYFMDSEVPGCPSDWIFATVPTGDSVTQCSIHVVTGEGQKPFAVGFDQVDRAGLVAWRAEGL